MITRRSALGMSLAAVAQPRRPNVVFVLVDDLRFDELRCTGHPFAESPNADRLAREGANFRNAFATTPLCSPSRATFLTGQYPRVNGVVDNTDRSPRSHQLRTWPRLLHDAGYETGFFGKWHMGNDDSPRPGFDRWVSFPGQGESTDPPLNIDGKPVQARGYITDILSDHAAEFLARKRSKPFVAYIPHKAIHPNIKQAADGSVTGSGTAGEFIVAPRHKTLYQGKALPRRGNYAKVPNRKPALAQNIPGVPPLSPATGTDDATILNRMRMTKAIDEGLGRMIEVLERNGQLDNTMFVYTSDHGYFYGEHCLGPERRLAYEETIRIPLIVRYPAWFKPGSRPEAMTLSTDIAHTMLALAGLPQERAMAGRPINAAAKRDDFLIEYHSDTVFKRVRKMGYFAVRTERWKYIHYREQANADELYDLRTDPFELDNRIADPRAPLAEMKQRLERLQRETGA